MSNKKTIQLAILVAFSLVLIRCNQGSCSDADQEKNLCNNSFVDLANTSATATGADALEAEPNDYFFQANVLKQTKNSNQKNKGSFDFTDNSYSRIGVFNNEVDEDWYAIAITSDDFDKLTASKTGCATDSITDFEKCYTCIPKKIDDDPLTLECDYKLPSAPLPLPEPNNISDYKEITSQTGFTQAKFFKPRFVVQIDSPDAEDFSVRVEVFPPGLTINYSGALTQKSVADSYTNVINTFNPLADGGPLRKVSGAGIGKLQLTFPIFWEQKVRVDNRDLNNKFYHNCAVQSVVSNPNPAKDKKMIEYQYLIEGNVNGFRVIDTYNVGIYYIRVRSNGNFKGKRYRLKWYWNTYDTSTGGVASYTLKADSTSVKTLKYAYDNKVQQTDGASGGSFLPSLCASQDGSMAPWYTSTDPYCLRPLFIADILCNDSLRQNADIYCYNARNIKVDTAASTNTLDLCVGDGNGDGAISSSAADILCSLDTSACDANQGYKESERACDCWNACNNPGGAPPGCI